MTQVFDGTTGLCSQPASIQKTRCFDEPPIMDNSKLVIRLGQRDWLSHDLMRVIAGILLSERLGYSVRFEDISSIPAKDPGLQEQSKAQSCERFIWSYAEMPFWMCPSRNGPPFWRATRWTQRWRVGKLTFLIQPLSYLKQDGFA